MPDTQTDDGRNTGRIVEIKGVVIDAVFADRLPEIYTALEIEVAEQDGTTRTLIAEVQQHLGDDRVRAVAMDSTDGLSRGTVCVDTEGPISVPVGDATLGRLWNVIGEPIDEAGAAPGGRRALGDPSRPACVPRPLAQDRDVRDRDQGHRPHRAVREGRQGRLLRRRRDWQDRPHPGADPQRRAAARRRLRLRRRGRANARGERPLARDDGVGRHRQGRPRLRADERAAGRAPARRALRTDDGGVLPRPGPGRPALHRQHLPLRPGGVGGLRATRTDAERRRLPADARDRDGAAPGADHVDDDGLGDLGAGDLRARRRPHRPGSRERRSRISTRPSCSSARSWRRASIPRSIRSSRCRARSSPESSPTTTTRSRRSSSRSSSATPTCRTSSPSSAWTSSRTRTRSSSPARARIERFLSQPNFVAEQFTGTPGKYVKLEDTIRSFQAIIDGEHDELPESAFYMVGTIDDAVEKARQAEAVAA